MMSLKLAVLLLWSLVFSVVHASPVDTAVVGDSPVDTAVVGDSPVDSGGVDVLAEYQEPEGTLTVYGYASGTVDAVDAVDAEENLVARSPCPSPPQINCSNRNTASASRCQGLFNVLRRRSNQPVPPSPRDICLGSSGFNRCCVSWSRRVVGINYGDLIPAARSAFFACRRSQAVSAFVKQVTLANVCLTQCLSNRPTGCTT